MHIDIQIKKVSNGTIKYKKSPNFKIIYAFSSQINLDRHSKLIT